MCSPGEARGGRRAPRSGVLAGPRPRAPPGAPRRGAGGAGGGPAGEGGRGRGGAARGAPPPLGEALPAELARRADLIGLAEVVHPPLLLGPPAAVPGEIERP